MSAPAIVLAAVESGRAEPLRAALRALPSGDASPFARITGTHLARWTVLEGIDRRPDRPGPGAAAQAHLLLSAQADTAPEDWLDALVDGAPAEVETIWGHCAGFPGLGDRAALRRWIAERRLEAGFSVVPYPRATVAEIRAALALRERLGAFAARAWRLGAEELHGAWRELLAGEGP